MEPHVALIVLCERVLTSWACLFILVQTLLQGGFTLGRIEFLRGVICLAYGPVGFALPLTAQGEEVVTGMALVTHPQGLLTSGVRARDQAYAAIGGHAEAVEAVIVKGFKRGFPRRGRALRSQCDFQDGGAFGVNGNQNRLVRSKNLVAEIQHDFCRPHCQGRGERLAIALEKCTEIAPRVGLIVEALQNRRDARKRASPFHASQQDEWCEMGGLVLTLALVVAQEHFQLESGGHKELIKKGPGDVIPLCDVRYLAVDALREPSGHDNFNPGLGRSIGASDKLHRVTSGRWWPVMNRNDSMLDSPSYHRQRFR
jgi:hypothetical protein